MQSGIINQRNAIVEKVLAAVSTGPGRTEIREFPMPDIPEDSALLKMEVAVICDTDVKLYAHPPTPNPVIMGHENIGTIAKAGGEFTRRKGGTIVVQGEMKEFPNFPLEKLTVKFITVKSARGHSYRACELALEQPATKRFPLEKVTTHRFGLKDADLAIRSVGGKGVPDVIHASLMPWK
jgi:threonine dehydrogenase-like Zn-dependent dehydrogenase